MIDQLSIASRYVEPVYSKKTIADVIPRLIANSLLSTPFKYNTGKVSISYTSTDLMTFTNRLGGAIHADQYDQLDNIILNFVKSYIGFAPQLTLVKLVFPEEEASKFEQICNTFKGKSWVDISSEFIHALQILLQSGYIINGD